MLSRCSYPQVSMLGRNLKPLSKYKGPILKLTDSEKAQIADMEKKIAEYELEISKLASIDQGFKIITSQSVYYCDQINHLEWIIDNMREAIREIKINRLNIQKSQLNK